MIAHSSNIHVLKGTHQTFLSVTLYNEQITMDSMVIFNHCFYYHAKQSDKENYFGYKLVLLGIRVIKDQDNKLITLLPLYLCEGQTGLTPVPDTSSSCQGTPSSNHCLD